MENKLKKLFEYQRFEKNAKLDAMIAQTRARYDAALSDEDLEMVAAAGEVNELDKAPEDGTPPERYGGKRAVTAPFAPDIT